jgi:hypothetical protein
VSSAAPKRFGAFGSCADLFYERGALLKALLLREDARFGVLSAVLLKSCKSFRM